MQTPSIQERLANLSRLNKDEQLRLRLDIIELEPQLLYPWWWYTPCKINVLLVVDGLNFGPGGSGLSNFITIFKKMELESCTNLKYIVTLADRRNVPINSTGMQAGNVDIDHRIVQFRFDNNAHFTSTKYDQVWLFGISPTMNLGSAETTAIENYMNNGGGLFATGDHGSLGKGMCGDIPRVRDMRYWDETDVNVVESEVSMRDYRRNDTNQPQPGQASSTAFNNQQDNIPQNIHPRMYSGLPHPLLSIPTSLSPSGIIHYMPDHPHEGECKPEIDFTVTNPKTGGSHTIRTQNIATSFVLSGNRAINKTPTIPHCFPSIGVFDGRSANVGRIVIDSTWHHFVNINLQGLDASNYAIIEQYFKNIARWMTRKKIMLCFYYRKLWHVLHSQRVMEAAMLNPATDSDKIRSSELASIGSHVLEIVGEDFSPAESKAFGLSLLESFMPQLANELTPWRFDRSPEADDPSKQWVNVDNLINTAIGTGVIRLRDEVGEPAEPITEDQEEDIIKVFEAGMKDGLERSINSFNEHLSKWSNLQDQIIQYDYLVEGVITDSKGNPKSGVIVRAVDQDFVTENRLGSDDTTQEDGTYSIPYKQTDFVINGKETGGADIILYIFDQDGKLLKKSKPHPNSPKQSTINIQLD